MPTDRLTGRQTRGTGRIPQEIENPRRGDTRDLFDPEKVVSTKDGKEAKVKDCIYFSGFFFLKDSKYTFQDPSDDQWYHKDQFHSYVIVGKKGDGYDYGQSAHPYNRSVLPIVWDDKQDGFVYILSEDLAKNLGFKEDITKTAWFHPSSSSKNRWKDESEYLKFNFCHFGKTDDKKLNLKLGLDSPTYMITEGKQYTFGVEFECSQAYVPHYKAKTFNLQCVRDGSLNGGAGGPEFVTGVLKGDYGFAHLQDICHELTYRGSVDKSCGLHLHLGGFNYSKENIVYLYKMCKLLEVEFFNQVPESRRNNTYCRALKALPFKSNLSTQGEKEYKITINEDFDKIFDYVAHQKLEHKSRKDNHPMGSKCSYDHKTPRYCWINFVPTVFNTRGNEQYTMEVRIHSGTTSYTKTKNWILLWMGVLWFVDNCKEMITDGLTLDTVIKHAYPKSKAKLLEYTKNRRELFAAGNESGEYKKTKEDKKSIKELCV